MNFNQEQSERIYQFIMRYNSEEEFKSRVQIRYDNEIGQLSILEIYALEEILRYGTKGIYRKFVVSKGAQTEAEAANLYDGFVKLLAEDENFKQYKTQQYELAKETLSEIELLIFSIISEPEKERFQKQEDKQEELEYDQLNPILYKTDRQIRATLESLFFGELIHKMLDLPSMSEIKGRQQGPGLIAKKDKEVIIRKIQELLSQEGYPAQLKQIIDSRYVKVKMDTLLGKGEAAFDPYVRFNTNISASEILGEEEPTYDEEVYNFFADVIKKAKEKNGGYKK